ncbi:MAG: vitamin K epoxide reductase family protein [Solirubrobacteraceae bacterium]
MSRKASALRIAMIVVVFLGIALASYLTYIHYSGAAPLCTSDSCTVVQHSTYSKLAGIPVALIGLIGYVLIFLSLLVPEGEGTRLATLGLTAIGFGFSVYLTGREVFSIQQICEECVTSACIMTVLFVLSVWRFLRGGPPPAQSPPVGDGSAAPLGARVS